MSHAVVTGPIVGSVTLPDGTEVDVTPPVIVVADQAAADAVAAAIAAHYDVAGYPDDTPTTPSEGAN